MTDNPANEPQKPVTPAPFDQVAYIKKQNEDEQARRDGKAATPAVPAVPAAAAEPATEVSKASRSERRRENALRDQLGAERGKNELLERQMAEMQKAPAAATKPAIEEDPEPQRRAFTTDAEYTRAVGAWDRRQETKKTAETTAQTAANEQALTALRAEIATADAKAVEDRKQLADWEAVKAAAEDSDDQPEFKGEDHPFLMRLLATSDVKAFVLYHLAGHPEEMQKLLDASGDLEKQNSLFRRLEGRVEKLHSNEKPADTKNEAAKPAESAAERDARKAKPSEAAAAQGGSAPVTTVSPTLSDGKTINPAWKEQQQTRAMARR